MKQFYETYGIHYECFLLWLSASHVKALPMTMTIQNIDNKQITKVSALRTQIEDEKRRAFLNDILLRLILSKTNSAKVSVGVGARTRELADFIASKHPELSGFNRRGLYRMKQFYETYGIHSECFLLWLSVNHVKALLMTMPI